MPHQQIPEGWFDYAMAGLLALAAWFGRKFLGRVDKLERRIRMLEGFGQLAEDRHSANVNRLERIEDKLDRLIERT